MTLKRAEFGFKLHSDRVIPPAKDDLFWMRFRRRHSTPLDAPDLTEEEARAAIALFYKTFPNMEESRENKAKLKAEEPKCGVCAPWSQVLICTRPLGHKGDHKHKNRNSWRDPSARISARRTT